MFPKSLPEVFLISIPCPRTFAHWHFQFPDRFASIHVTYAHNPLCTTQNNSKRSSRRVSSTRLWFFMLALHASDFLEWSSKCWFRLCAIQDFSRLVLTPSIHQRRRPPSPSTIYFLFFIAFRFLRSFIYISLCCYVLAVRELLFFSLFFIHKGLGVSETHERREAGLNGSRSSSRHWQRSRSAQRSSRLLFRAHAHYINYSIGAQ